MRLELIEDTLSVLCVRSLFIIEVYNFFFFFNCAGEPVVFSIICNSHRYQMFDILRSILNQACFKKDIQNILIKKNRKDTCINFLDILYISS